MHPELSFPAGCLHFQAKMQSFAIWQKQMWQEQRVKISSTESSSELPDVWINIALMIHAAIPKYSDSSHTYKRFAERLSSGSLSVPQLLKMQHVG